MEEFETPLKKSKGFVNILRLLLYLGTIPALYIAMISTMIFDAPDSKTNVFAWIAFVSLWIEMPVIFLVAHASRKLQRQGKTKASYTILLVAVVPYIIVAGDFWFANLGK